MQPFQIFRICRAFTTALLIALVTALLGVATGCQPPFTGVLTFHNDSARDGVNSLETTLTPANVNATDFGKVFSFPVDGDVYAQPLYVPTLTIPSNGIHNVLYVATEHDSVYAFDADGLSNTPLWQTSFIDPANGITTVPSEDTGSNDIFPEVGITGTPVIDRTSNTLYVVDVTKNSQNMQNPIYQWNLHALDLTTGAEKFGGPVLINPTLYGTSGGTFDALTEGQRSALLVTNGVVYVPFASHGSVPPYHGLLLAFSASNLNQLGVFDVTPDGTDGGIWECGNGASTDASGSIYVATGNGSFDQNADGVPVDLGDSAISLSFSPSSGLFSLNTYFTPWNQAVLQTQDIDLGDSGLVLLPDQTVGPVHLGVVVGKDGNIYLLNRDNMGGYNTASMDNSNIVQEVAGALSGQGRAVPAFFNQTLYYAADNYFLKGFTLSAGKFPASANLHSSMTFGYPGTSPSVSSNGNQNAIVWTLMIGAYEPSTPAILYAFDTHLNELYDTTQAPLNRDQPGDAVKFTTPTIANGRVYVGTQTEVDVYGLLPAGGAVKREP